MITGVRSTAADVTSPIVCEITGVHERDRAQIVREWVGLQPRLRGDPGSPERAWATTAETELVSTAGAGPRARRAECAVDDAAVLHFGREQAQGQLGACAQETVAGAERAVGRCDEQVALGPQRHGVDVFERLVVDVGEAGVELPRARARWAISREVAERSVTCIRGWCSRKRVVIIEEAGTAVGMAPIRSVPSSPPAGAGSPPAPGRAGRRRRAAPTAAHRSPSGVKPSKRRLRRTSGDAELALQAPHRRLGQRRLRDVAGGGGAAEVPLAVEGDEVLELAGEHFADLQIDRADLFNTSLPALGQQCGGKQPFGVVSGKEQRPGSGC